MEVLAIIPARGGSKGIPKKNIVECAGRPLLSWTIDAVKQSQLVNFCILSSDSEDIMTEANNQGIDTPFVRPKHLSEDDTPSLLVIEHSVEWAIQNNYCKPDIIVVLQSTSPLRMSNHIDEAVQLLINDKEADSIVSVTDVPHNYSPESVMIINNGYLKSFIKQNEMLNMRQLKSNFLARNGAAIYAFRTNCLLEKNSIYGEKIIPYRMDQKHSIDIDTPFDLLLCDMLLKNKNKIKD